MFRRVMLTLSCVVLLCGAMLAQKTITGRLVSGDESLVGASIVAKGTPIGTVTDIDGKYTLTVPPGAEVLVFSYVGYKTMEENIGGRTTIDVTLEASGAVDHVEALAALLL